ncbi:Uncharacterized protein dnm_094370 [Desulfonema magnum]|uniref:Uncharacterized protein n=1 Tax=Desulfonema magnum TaxID=45655 RepID=A0A975BX13_9BACT|nr:Uncharacterized protein dnm_094370 [Desulfonema magnum]
MGKLFNTDSLIKKFRADPECKNCIFALAKKHFSHSGKNTGKPVQP